MKKRFFHIPLRLATAGMALLLSCAGLRAQTAQIDSLLQVLGKTESGKSKVLLYAQLGRALRDSDTTRAVSYLNQGLELAQTVEFHLGAGEVLTQRAALYTVHQNYSEAIRSYNKAIDAYKRIDRDDLIMARYRAMATIMMRIGHNTDALEYELEAYVHAQVLGDKDELRSIAMRLASIYGNRLQDYPKALEFQSYAYEYCKEVCGPEEMATALNNLGSSYKDSKMFPEALEVLHQSRRMNEEHNRRRGLIYNFATLSEVHQRMGNIDSAYYYAEVSLKYSIEEESNFDILYGYNDLGRVLLGQGRHQEAIPYLEKAYNGAAEAAKENVDYVEIVKLATSNLYVAYEQLGNYAKAYRYLKQHSNAQQELYDTYLQKAAQIQAFYDDEKRQAEITRLNQANAIKEAELRTATLIEYTAFIACIVVLVFVAYMYRNMRKKQESNELLQSKNKAIQKRNREIAEQKEQMEQAFKNVKLLSEIGQEVTSLLSVERIIKTAYTNVNNLMRAEGFGIGIYNEEQKRIEFPGFIEKGITYPMSYDLVSNDSLLSVWSFLNQKEVFINSMADDYSKYIKRNMVTLATTGEVPESILYIPLNTKDRKIGVITVQSFQKNAYTEYHVDILRNLAIYVAIALENADNFKRIEQTSNELERQKELIEEKNITLGQQNEKIEQAYENIKLLGKIGQSIIAELSVAKIVATVYQNVNQLMDASVFWIGIFDKEQDSIHFEGAIENGKVLEPFSMPAKDKNRLASWCLENNEEIFINDYLRDYGKYISIIKPTVAGEHAASIIYLPLSSKDGKLGVITVQSFRKYAYTDYHVNMLRNLATYASIALENAILYQSLEQKVEERTAEIEAQKSEIEQAFKNIKLLSEIGQVLTGMLSTDQIIAAVYAHVNDLMEASAFGIGIYDEDIDKIMFRGAMEEGRELPVFFHDMDEKRYYSAWCLKNRKEVVTNNAQQEYVKYFPEMAPPKEGKTANSIIYLPLNVKDKSLGVITVQSYQLNAYSEYHVNILRNLAIYAGIALENAAAYLQIEQQNEEINKSTQKIRSSINYAKRIQNAILPHRSTIENAFSDAFVLFKPRDIVSGDFFWYAERGNRQFLAAVDCTGHGVPGAFMSMIGNDLLDEIINVLKVESVDVILEEMHNRVRKALRQKETDNRDGMDMALCMIDRDRQVLEFAGAKNPLVYIDLNEEGKPELFTIKGDKMPIGGVQREHERKFTKHTIKLRQTQPALANGAEGPIAEGEPMTFYIFSDGYQDQFGGRDRRKFMFKNMKNLLYKIHDQPMANQRETLKGIIDMWMENEQQTDDILVIGFRV
jgi:transcriptional regulator with GAF, ATPase, and Fis domain/tetratricopeptide (TPR) repeat protein